MSKAMISKRHLFVLINRERYDQHFIPLRDAIVGEHDERRNNKRLRGIVSELRSDLSASKGLSADASALHAHLRYYGEEEIFDRFAEITAEGTRDLLEKAKEKIDHHVQLTRSEIRRILMLYLLWKCSGPHSELWYCGYHSYLGFTRDFLEGLDMFMEALSSRTYHDLYSLPAVFPIIFPDENEFDVQAYGLVPQDIAVELLALLPAPAVTAGGSQDSSLYDHELSLFRGLLEGVASGAWHLFIEDD